MEIVSVISPIFDEDIQRHFEPISRSKIWGNCYHPGEITEEIRKRYPVLYKYDIKFQGTKPVQCTKIMTYEEGNS